MEEAVYFKVNGDAGYVRAVGHMTALLCPGLKAKIFASLDAPQRPKTIHFDLSACEYMDSTFLGLIVGVCKKLGAANGRKPVLHGVNEACVGLLRTIGVVGLVELSAEPIPPIADMERIEGGQRATARFLLDAHEDLSALSAENKGRFATLSSALRGAIGEDDEKDGS